MNWYSFAAVVSVLIIGVGVVLLFIWHLFSMVLHDRKMRHIEQFIKKYGKQILVEATSECMDILPEKIQEVKKNIEEG